MSENLPTIWMNVTTSANWRRPPVGIVRVERSLCAELGSLYGERFKQCVWQDGKFVEWRPQAKQQDNSSSTRLEQHTQKQQIAPILAPIFPILPKRQALIALAQGLLSLMPGKVQPSFNRLLYVLRPLAVRMIASNKLRRIVASIRGKAAKDGRVVQGGTSEKYEIGSVFAAGDVLISVGLDWDHPYYKQFYSLRKQAGVKVVTCCYDLIPVLYPQYCVNDVAGLFTSYFLDVADGSDLVLCISRQSEKDFNEMLYRTGGAMPSTHVFPLGDNVPVGDSREISPSIQSLCLTPFILFVSTIERRKNHEILYRAYHLLCAQGKADKLPRLVFVGMDGWGVNDLLKDIELDPLTKDMIVRLSHVNDAELRALYEAAKFCVFPSLYEGWGLPVGEALSMGKAVISSNRGSIPEVGGQLVRYVDPWNPQAWADEIYQMAIDDLWRKEWEKKVISQYHQRTWAEAAASVKHRIDELL